MSASEAARSGDSYYSELEDISNAEFNTEWRSFVPSLSNQEYEDILRLKQEDYQRTLAEDGEDELSSDDSFFEGS